jgi:hypothetical protein
MQSPFSLKIATGHDAAIEAVARNHDMDVAALGEKPPDDGEEPRNVLDLRIAPDVSNERGGGRNAQLSADVARCDTLAYPFRVDAVANEC